MTHRAKSKWEITGKRCKAEKKNQKDGAKGYELKHKKKTQDGVGVRLREQEGEIYEKRRMGEWERL